MFTNEFPEQISKCEPEEDSGTLKSGTTTGKGKKSDPDVGSLGGQIHKWVSTTKFKKCELEEDSGTLKRDNKSFGSIH